MSLSLVVNALLFAQASASCAFADQRLEAAVRTALSIEASVDLDCRVLSALDSLVAAEDDIESLEGMQQLVGLEYLDLWGNAVTDIRPLAELTALTSLELGNNAITDVSALAGLTRLTRLGIRENDIPDIRAIEGLTELTDLDISFNRISDISPMSGLTRLETLRVYDNPISDIGAMRGLTRLHELHVHDLPDLASLQPLVDNTGLEPDDIVYIYGSNASCSDVRALREKGLSVSGCEIEYLRRWWWAILLGAGLVGAAAVVRRRRNERRWAAWRAEAGQ